MSCPVPPPAPTDDTPVAPRADRSLEALRTLVEATTGTGQPFFEALAVNLTRSLGVKHAMIGELTEERPDQSRVFAVAWDGELGRPFTYALDGTPCERALAAGELAYYPAGVAGLFPRDVALARRGIEDYMGCPLLGPAGDRLGILVVLHDRPLDEATAPRTILRIFANRAAAELARLRADQAHRRADAQLRFALQAARMATFDWNPASGVTTWSDGALELLDAQDPGFTGTYETLISCVVPDDRPVFAECATAVMEGRRDVIDLQYRVLTRDGKPRWMHQRGTVTPGLDGRPTRVSGVVADVSDRRLLEEQLLHAQKLDAVGRLAGGIAHDFNNLLTVIRGFGEMADEELVGHPARELVAPIRDAAERASALTRQLLSFARRQVTAPKVLEPTAVVRELGALVRRLVGEPIRLVLSLAPETWPVRIDPGQLEQVLVNLAVNARDAMPGGGLLQIGSSNVTLDAAQAAGWLVSPGDYALLRVQDNGVGMDEAIRLRCFEPFFTTKGPDRGTGLGLATCHGIIRQAGGAIAVESAPGQGTTLSFVLPRHVGDLAAGVVPSPRPAARRGSETILFVEDEDAVRAVGVRALSNLGYRVLPARDGEEALQAAADHPGPIDLVVTDMVLPRLDGSEMARRLAAVRPELKFLFTSGYSDRLPPSLAAAFLPKPYTPTELGRRITEVLRPLPSA
jgi:two-component system, cell cycle sensor histidine kinase and response regulator CckA